MKIKTITCHDVYNYGASLQAYALQAYLSLQGHDVEIINYKPPYLSGHYQLSRLSHPMCRSWLLRVAYRLAKWPAHLVSLRRRDLFDQFTQQYLQMTHERYSSNHELERAGLEADLFLAGSDQIWNTAFPNGRDPAFYLSFVGACAKKASYAASFATETVDAEFREFVRQHLLNFNAISIREQESLPLLHSLGIDHGTAVMDPVFLLDSAHWSALAAKGAVQVHEPYILIYNFEASSVTSEIIKEMKTAFPGISVYELSPVRLGLGRNIYRNVGPLQFLRLIQHAHFVISNSFHATAFSILFEKNFCVVNRSDQLNIRMKSLLNDLGFSDRLATQYSPRLLEKPDYAAHASLIRTRIQASKVYLQSIIQK